MPPCHVKPRYAVINVQYDIPIWNLVHITFLELCVALHVDVLIVSVHSVPYTSATTHMTYQNIISNGGPTLWTSRHGDCASV